MESFDRLVQMVPPPPHPFDAGSDEHWQSVEKMLGLALPSDFKRLILTYGTGCWQEFWYLLNPNTSNRHLNFIAHSQCLLPKMWSTLDSERMIREQEKETYPHPIYPEPGGILAWATTDNGGRFYWLTAGPPEQWPTIYYPDRAPDFVVYNRTYADLLFGAVSGALPVFAEAFGPDHEYGRPDAFAPRKYDPM